ncbi:MAG: chorismate-binding protein [Bacteroidia bacterium]
MNFALFRLPHTNDIKLWIGEIEADLTPLEFNQELKFIIGKFNSSDLVYQLKPSKQFMNEEIDYAKLNYHLSNSNSNKSNKTSYCKIVEKAVKKLQNNSTLKKVVLTRSAYFNEDINPIESFKNLCNAYPNAFIHLSSTKNTGTWLGASPEQFLSLKDKQLKTVALAGTLQNSGEKINWSEKELKEQNWVEIHIESVLNSLNIPYVKTGPQTMQIGHLKHLLSTYMSIPKNVININKLIKELNPTPAVGGISKIEAIELISELEEVNRDLYTGIIGPYYSKNNIELFVNLRCLQIHQKGYTQYAGAGITEESNPEKEWLETENKIAMTRNLLEFKN